MKIVIVIDSWNEGNGGVVAIKRVCKELVARGHRISIVCTGKHEDADFEFYEVPGFYLPFVKESMQKMNFLFGRGKKRVLRKAYKGADLVQVQFPFFLARNAVRVAKKMGVPVMGAFHVQPQNITGAMGKEDPKMEKLLHAFFNFTLFNRVDVVHCPSPFAADLLTRHKGKAYKRVISNGIPAEYRPRKTKRPEWFGDKFVIVNIGRHALEKRQGFLIEALLKSKHKDNIQLLLCGRGENTGDLKKLGRQLPVEPFIEYVSNEDKITYLNNADLYLHASVVELESLTCLEAIGCGLPCLIGRSPYSAASQFAFDERFLFTVDDTDGLAGKIDFWYENRQLLAELRPAIIAMAEQFRMTKCIDEIENLHKDMLTYYSADNKETFSGIQATREQRSIQEPANDKEQVSGRV